MSKEINGFSSKRPKLILGIALGVFAFLLYQIVNKTGWNLIVDFEEARLFATTLSGLLSFISIWLIYSTIENQVKTFRLNQFENKFFEQVKFHRKNVDDLTYKTARLVEKDANSDLSQPVYEKGNRVIYEIYKEVSRALKEVREEFEKFDKENKRLIKKNEPPKRIYRYSYLKRFINLESDIYSRENLHKLAQIEIAYITVFFGLAKTGGLKSWERIMKERYNHDLITNIKSRLSKIVTKWDRFPKVYEKHGSLELAERVEKNIHIKFFGGHQGRLGHYFRNLFQTVKYVDQNDFLTYKQKYQYTKTLRAQLTTYEQCLLYLNSISLLGRVWELDLKGKNGKLSNKSLNNQLITKYNLIKNIPGEFFVGIDVKDFYPSIQYEGWDKSEERKGLEKKYK